MIETSVDADGIATVAWNMADRPMNVMNAASIAAFARRIEAALADPSVKGIVVASARPDFIVGADLREIAALTEPADILAFVHRAHALFRLMEKGGKPIVAAIGGTALGGGLELALACHRRIAASGPGVQLGLPEVSLGLLPGAGGTQRLPRLIGAAAALPLLVEGKKIGGDAALAIGLVDAVVPAAELLRQAKAWLLAAGAAGAAQPWDRKGASYVEAVESARGRGLFTAATAKLRERTSGEPGAALAILSCVYEGLHVDIDTALAIETRYFLQVMRSAEARNRIAVFFALGDAKKPRRPKDRPARRFGRIGVLGAGMMGGGIALATAQAGMDVVLLDATADKAEAGKRYAEEALAKLVGRGRLGAPERDVILARICPTAAYEDLSGCELVVEAVFESRSVKAEVTTRAEAVLGTDAVFASNTSTLPITGLAEASARPASFIGLHFFSPADRMTLVEVIRGRETSDETLWAALDFVGALRKTPIVVNDARGFYTSRVVESYVNEGVALLQDGVLPALIEAAGRRSGMPVGPLALADEVALDLLHALREQTRTDLGEAYRERETSGSLRLMVETLGRTGRKVGKGFYDYPDEGPKRLWQGASDHWPPAAEQPPLDAVIRRLVYIQSVETARAIGEGVVANPADADVGAVLGWGYPQGRGGPVRQMDEVGLAPFVAECDALAAAHGERFSPPPLLREMAARGGRFYAA